MPLWIIVMLAGATFTGWVFLKARQMESKNTLKKVKAGHKSVKKAAKTVAARPSTVEVKQPITSAEEISMSRDVPSKVASEIEAIQKAKEAG